MIVFAHLHKAAGTSVVNAAIRSGLRLPENHENGHPLDEMADRIQLNAMQKEDIHSLFVSLQEQEVEFVAFEWGFPRFESFADIEGLRFLTVLRDPVDRAISNYRMDVLYKYAGKAVFGFDSYTREQAVYTASNYYIRFFCDLDYSSPVTIEHYKYTKTVLRDHFQTVVLGRDSLADSLCELGFDRDKFSHDNAMADNERFANYSGIVPIRVNDEDVASFIANNSFDIALFRSFFRGGRID